ncbi:MAG: porin [Pirellulaceae bacterium]
MHGRLYLTGITLLAFLVLATPGQAEDDYTTFINGGSVASSLDTLAAELDEQADRIAELESAIDKKVSPGSSASTMKVAGRIHADFWGFPYHDPAIEPLEGGNPQNRLGFRRIRISFAGTLPANMLYKAELDFANGSDLEFKDNYLGWKDLPLLQTLLLGNQKRPYGLDHLNSSRFNVFLERPFIVEAFNEDARRFGLASYGTSENQAWNWRYGVYNSRNIARLGNYVGDHGSMEVAGRLATTFWYDEASNGRRYGHFAISGTLAEVDEGSTETRFRSRPEARSSQRWLNTGTLADAASYDLLGLEGVLNFGPVQLVAEAENVWMTLNSGQQVHYYGAYAYVSYFLTGEHMPWSRSRGTLDRVQPHEEFSRVRTSDGKTARGKGAWQVAARWSMADFSDVLSVPGATPDGVLINSFTLGVNWYWTAHARMQFNWITGRVDDGAGNIGDYDIIGTRFAVDF